MAGNNVTVVMYHYVRELKKSRFPNIRGLAYEVFKEQIRYMKRRYNFISAEDLIAALDDGQPLPENAILLTFDDSYTDHYTYVFPVLYENGIKGCFYSPVMAVRDRKILDVNKIHLILSRLNEEDKLVRLLHGEMDLLRFDFELETYEAYWQQYGKPTLLDTPKTAFFKRMLQDGLKGEARTRVLNSIFSKVVDDDEAVLSTELYLNMDQMRCMISNGMHFGIHGHSHTRLHTLSYEKQDEEITGSIAFLTETGVPRDKISICYPYGSYNEDTVKLAAEKGCRFGLTIKPEIYDMERHSRFEIPRIDTNEITAMMRE